MRKTTGRVFLGFVAVLATAASLRAALQFDKSEYAARRARLMEKIPDGAAIILGAKVPPAYNEYFQNNDFMYLCGVEIPDAALIIDGAAKRSTLFFSIDERGARSEGISLELVRNPMDIAGVEAAAPIEGLGSAVSRLVSQGSVLYTSFKPEELMRECSNEKFNSLQRSLTLDLWDGRLTRELQFVKQLKDKFPQAAVRDVSGMIWDLRTIKTPAEAEVMRKAGRIAVKAYIELMKATKPGMYEYELAALYEYLCKREGAQDLAYYMIMCSAENHPYLHYYKHDRQLKDGDLLVVDVGPDYGYYDIDITVTYPVSGRFTPRQKEVYEASKAVHEANLKVYRPGLTVEQCRKEVAEILAKQGFDLNKDYFKKMQGGFGHYVGLAVHDVGGGPSVLKPGMVIANEPLVVYEAENLGVRVEDTILITETGCENLTAGIPREVKDIEALMKQPGIPQVLKKTN